MSKLLIITLLLSQLPYGMSINSSNHKPNSNINVVPVIIDYQAIEHNKKANAYIPEIYVIDPKTGKKIDLRPLNFDNE